MPSVSLWCGRDGRAALWLSLGLVLGLTVRADTGELHQAIQQGNAMLVEALVEADAAAVHAPDKDGATALHVAVKAGRREIVSLLLSRGAAVNARETRTGGTPLMVAALTGSREIAEALLAADADVNAASFKGTTPLHVAASLGHVEVVKLLLASGAAITNKTAKGLTALQWAQQKDQQAAADLILAAGTASVAQRETAPVSSARAAPGPAPAPEPPAAEAFNAAWTQQVARLEQALDEAVAVTRQARRDLDQAVREREALEQQNRELRAATGAVAAAAADLTAARDDLAAQAQAVSQLTARVTELEETLAQALQARAALERRYTNDVSAARLARDFVVADLNQELDEAVEQIAQWEERMAAAAAAHERLEAADRERAVLAERLTHLEDDLAQARDEGRRVKQALEAAQAEKTALEQQWRAAAEEHARASEAALAALNAKLRDAETALVAMERRVDEERALTEAERRRREEETAQLNARIVQLTVRLKESEGASLSDVAVSPSASPLPPPPAARLAAPRFADSEMVLLDRPATSPLAAMEGRAPFATNGTLLANRPALVVRQGDALAPAPSRLGESGGEEAERAYACVLHVHSRASSGRYTLSEMTFIAARQGVDAVFLSDSLTESIQYGLPPLRHVFWIGHHRPSVLRLGAARYLDEIRRENERQSDVLYVPGVELIPRMHWTGSLLQRDLVCHNHQRNLIVMGVTNAADVTALPVACGYLPGRDTGWIVGTRALLLAALGLTAAMLVFVRRLARRSGYSVWALLRAYGLGVLPPLIVVLVLVNIWAARRPAFDLYSPDRPDAFEQSVVDAVRARGWPQFWAHPEAADEHALRFLGVPFKARTEPYPDLLLQTRGYTGFGGVNEGQNTLILTGSVWDTVLRDYTRGARAEPAWCFGEMLYHYEGQAGKKLSNVETMIWSAERTAPRLLDALRLGRFYVRYNHGEQGLLLRRWRVGDAVSGGTTVVAGDRIDLALSVASATPGEKVEVWIVRNGETIQRVAQATPFELNLTDTPPPAAHSYYRALVFGPYPLTLVANPIFVRRAAP